MLDSFRIVNDIASILSKLPGVGKKTALKYTLWFIKHKNDALTLSEKLGGLYKDIKICKKCRGMTENEDGICDICKDETRDSKTICVIENMENFFAIESSSVYNGIYYILDDFGLSSYTVDVEKMGLVRLVERIIKEGIKEVILVISSTMEGDLTTQYIKERLKNKGVNITRIAYGIPVGVNVNFMDKATLIEAFKSRRAV